MLSVLIIIKINRPIQRLRYIDSYCKSLYADGVYFCTFASKGWNLWWLEYIADSCIT